MSQIAPLQELCIDELKDLWSAQDPREPVNREPVMDKRYNRVLA